MRRKKERKPGLTTHQQTALEHATQGDYSLLEREIERNRDLAKLMLSNRYKDAPRFARGMREHYLAVLVTLERLLHECQRQNSKKGKR